MLVNSIDISTYKAKLLSKDIQTSEVTIYDDWLRKSLSPIYFGKKETYKQIKLQFLVEDADEYNCLVDIGNLILQLEKSTIKFDNLAFYYDSTIVSKSHVSVIQNGSYIAENPQNLLYTQDVELRAPFAYLPSVIVLVSSQSQTITIQGNLKTTAIVTLIPSANIGSATITGFGKDITVRNLKTNIPVIVDGEQGLITENGVNKFSDSDIWDFPVLNPGANVITINVPGVTLNVQYKPKFM